MGLFSWIFGRRKREEEFFLQLIRASSEGKDRQLLYQAMSVIGFSHKPVDHDNNLVGQFASHFTIRVAEMAGADIRSNGDHLFVAAILSLVACNHFSRLIACEFETSSLLSWAQISGEGEENTMINIDAIREYNRMSGKKSGYLQALGQSISDWVTIPSDENLNNIINLFKDSMRMTGRTES